MLHAVKLKPDVYWVGAVDWESRSFHGYTTYRGSTYNAYLIMDEKITLIDTVKNTMTNELIERISDIVDPSKIDYLISNHVEMDHSGSLPAIMDLAPDAKIITSDPQGLKGLTAHYGVRDYQAVGTGDTLDIGKRTLTFIKTQMVHWPDNMVTYDVEDKILFSNDSFGQHFASSGRFDDENELDDVMGQAQKYYANIIMPYSKMVLPVLETIKKLDIDLIAPAHGIIWRSHIVDILRAYDKWAKFESDDYALVVYDSMYHTTEKMALQFVEAFTRAGISVRLFDLKVDHYSDVLTEILTARYVAVGSPTLNMGMLPTVAGFLHYLRGLSPKNTDRFGFAFGSYGWAPVGPKGCAEGLKAAGYEVACDPYTHNWPMTTEELADLQNRLLADIEAVQKLFGIAQLSRS